MEQLILHLLGDYVTQSDWMANNKTTKHIPALVHATVYSLPFLLLTRSPLALFVIWLTHFLIDRFRLAKYVVYVKNFIAPRSAVMDSNKIGPPVVWFLKTKYYWENCQATGYPSETPVWLAVWLMIIADNTMHLGINYLSLRFL
jgi:hypothetical protein